MGNTIPRDYAKSSAGQITNISVSAQLATALYQRVIAYFECPDYL